MSRGQKPKSHCKRGHDLSITRKRYRNGHPYCYECRRASDRARWRRLGPTSKKVHFRAYILKKVYGLEVADYEAILAAQNGACAICKSTEWGGKGNPHVDHDHGTGRIRGLLCHCCNTALGLFRDSKQNLESAVQYLERGCAEFDDLLVPDQIPAWAKWMHSTKGEEN